VVSVVMTMRVVVAARERRRGLMPSTGPGAHGRRVVMMIVTACTGGVEMGVGVRWSSASRSRACMGIPPGSGCLLFSANLQAID